jgi:hypothetical protein
MNPDVNKPPTCFNVYNPDTILQVKQPCKWPKVVHVAVGPAPLVGFIKKIKTFSYNKKDLA